MVSPNLTEIVTTTLRNRSKELADNVSANNGLLTRLKSQGNIKSTSGGRNITKELTYAENGNFQYYSGYEILDISPSDTISAAEFPWKQAAVNVSMSGLEERQNSGPEAQINLLESRIENAIYTMNNQISVGVYSDGAGSGGKQIGGLQLLVADDPTVGSVGGISRVANDWWQNKKFSSNADGGSNATASNITGYMNTIYNQLVRGNDAPDLLVADIEYFGLYQEALQQQQRFTGDGSADLGAAGFTSIKYRNSDVILENGSGILNKHMYFLNTRYIFLEVHPAANMTPLDSQRAVNQDAMVIPILWQGNMTASNLALQGVLIN